MPAPREVPRRRKRAGEPRQGQPHDRREPTGLGSRPEPGAAVDVRPRWRGRLHQAGFVVSLVTGTVLLIDAGSDRARLAVAAYALSVCALFGTSALYHRRTWSGRAAGLMRRLDHSMIFVLIAGTYTPFLLLLLGAPLSWAMVAAVWTLAGAGVAMRMAWLAASRWLVAASYLGLGWAGAVMLPEMTERTGPVVVALIVAGGGLYTLGAVVYARRRPDPAPTIFGFHEVFHACTVLAAAAHYTAITLVLIAGAGTAVTA